MGKSTLISQDSTLKTSISSYSSQLDEFGLSNRDGEFNCFLNVVLQALWHSEPFRKKLLEFKLISSNPKFKEYKLISEI